MWVGRSQLRALLRSQHTILLNGFPFYSETTNENMATINWKSGHSVGKSTCAVDWQIPTWFASVRLYKFVYATDGGGGWIFKKSIYFPVNVFVLGTQLAGGEEERTGGGQQPAAFKHRIILRLFYRATIFSCHIQYGGGGKHDHFIYATVRSPVIRPFSVSMHNCFALSFHITFDKPGT